MEIKNEICVIATLVARRESNGYITYVFKVSFDKYIMCTRLPNWHGQNIEIGQEGYMTYSFIQAGIDKWYNAEKDRFENYVYSANYFTDFVPISHVIDGNTITKLESITIH